ncbi:MAG: hypothetical protein GF411_03060 [Candidatus Lokiarchaeota archaeon]|nr:hypothetical protein [Candidatus Lokiarchaeota archaeon]
MTKQNEEQKDSEAPDISKRLVMLRQQYTQLVVDFYRLRKTLELDFIRIKTHLKEAREASHSQRINILNGVLEYLDEAIPELRKSRISLKEQMGEVADYVDEKEGSFENLLKTSGRFF